MRKVALVVVLLAAMYFIGGWLTVLLRLLEKATYLEYAAIVGGLASVAGLLTIARPPFTDEDLHDININYLKAIAEKTENIRALEAAKATTQDQIEALGIQKKEMELLVKKASMALFLRSQHDRYSEIIREEVEKNAQLGAALRKAEEIDEALYALNEEIESDKQVAFLREIMDEASDRRERLEELILGKPFLTQLLIRLSDDLSYGLQYMFLPVMRFFFKKND